MSQARDKLNQWLEKAKSKGKKIPGLKPMKDVKIQVPGMSKKKKGVKIKKIKYVIRGKKPKGK